MADQAKTVEQLEQETIINLEQSKESNRFMRRNPLFKANPGNAQKMGEFIKAGGFSWTADSLEQIFKEHNKEFEKNEPWIAPKPPPPPEVEEKLPAWGRLRNRIDVGAIPRSQYRAWLKNPDFVKDVNAALRGAQ
jgi:hypothetical protein